MPGKPTSSSWEICRVSPVPGILVALAFLMAIGSAWWREGR
jgi:hypothetical protein